MFSFSGEATHALSHADGTSAKYATAAVAGLFLEIRNHASLFNLEVLALFALTHATGQKSATHRELRAWTKRIGQSPAANQTDSPEDG